MIAGCLTIFTTRLRWYWSELHAAESGSDSAHRSGEGDGLIGTGQKPPPDECLRPLPQTLQRVDRPNNNIDNWIRDYKSIYADVSNLRCCVQRDYSDITGKAASAVIASVRPPVAGGRIQLGENELNIRLITGDMMCLEMLPLVEITNPNDAPGEEDSDFVPYVISEAEVKCFNRAGLDDV
ncbi:hypothetical protein BZA05DRAFT_422809 [Tricharina praecox]|uniref:uncharacterized protein n=1 Tax=Tricharina praecox TaxID=43433 RepID=UPI00221FDF33|nr:uncharacterized protein BZA05DRAFT_422809 [Tricharina praecox]KAI5841606.1 hypothetical protein BZA05DRAFT_422809 [Tricharina praecox]